MEHLRDVLREYFLTDDNLGCAFVAWNANRFDAYFIAAALLFEADLLIKPYMTKSKALRGLRIMRAVDGDRKNAKAWEFLDGIAMTGLVGTSLADFVANFAPHLPKLKEAIDFSKETFNPKNKKHVEYAERDSIALYAAITKAQQILLENFDEPLAVTMGGACIKIFAANIPPEIKVEPLTYDMTAIVFRYVMRGGFCFCNRRYEGPVWKYDINQAYAAAMRDEMLPCGSPIHRFTGPKKGERVYMARLKASNDRNKVPFYFRGLDEKGRLRSLFALNEISETWLTSVEIEQLQREQWSIEFMEIYVWPDSFSMVQYVDGLERLRTTCEGGPKGPIGTMTKAVGNHSYGKTVEQIEPLEFVIASECPDGFVPWYDSESDELGSPIDHIFYRIDDDRKPKAYHQPHLGAWITAHVRMKLRRTILINPDSWLYADTDCVIFSCDVTEKMDIDPARYGAYKIEETGTVYQIIAKKVYRSKTGNVRHAKGLNVKRLTDKDFDDWYTGKEPEQEQTQIQNFLSVMSGSEMFRSQKRKGTKVEILTME